MSEQRIDMFRETFVGPEAPAQDIASCADDILLQVGTRFTYKNQTHWHANWVDVDNGQSLYLRGHMAEGISRYRLQVTETDTAETVANYGFATHHVGATLCDSSWHRLEAPGGTHDRAMAGYLRTAKGIAWRNGTPEAGTDEQFWPIVGQYALAHPTVVEIVRSVSQHDADLEVYLKQEKAANQMRQLEPGLCTGLIYALIESSFSQPAL